MEAYILIEIKAGRIRDVLERIGGIEGVASVAAVVGPFDIIAYVKTKDMKSLAELVVSRIHNIDGVNRTITCPVVEL